ncbi:hypothetical protein MAPG_10690 [Magnaporthiopsis poae ATCC 64411]|uniref:Uncharacterized protein n=1 Tax=Magnaporthiopsis poae (strain ATCC 64411 / 73-15) TaxID=644358 RepID=A0A0C4ED96_MAGP6|nr:hypothetical protein MAPG_10690 [Magnaporthiopsis poae ATCC 64411]
MDDPLYFFPTIVAIVVIVLSSFWFARRHSADSKEDLSSKPKEVPPPTPRRGAGLTQVYPDVEGTHGSDSTEELTVDIVAIHGLGARADTTWLAYKNGKDSESGYVHWLKDGHMLPAKIPYARILTYDWNADIGQDTSADFFHGHAEAFLHQLSRDRKDSGRVEYPLIFVASCFGGLLLIKALLRAANESGASYGAFRPILDSTIAVAFLGTPFSGTSRVAVVAAQARVQNAGGRGGDELVRYLGPDGELDGLVRDFIEHIGKRRFSFKLACFYENYPTGNDAHVRGLPEGTLEGEFDPRGKELVVGRKSACLYVADVEHIALEVRHNMLNKFNSPTDGGYKQVAGKLKDYAEETKEKKSCVLVNKEAWEACLRSLSFPQMTDRLNDIHSALDGTCRWLLEHNTYKRWAASDRSILWIRGKPGSGKSTLMKFAIANAKSLPDVDDQSAVFSFFFHGRGGELQKTLLGFWRALLFHFLKLVPEALAGLVQTYQERTADRGEHGEKWQWHQGELRSFFESALPKILRSRRVLVYIDALDECGKDGAAELVRIFESLLKSLPPRSAGLGQFRTCFSCRPYPNLHLDDPIPGRYAVFKIRPEHENSQDISTFVDDQLADFSARNATATTIPALIKKRASGVFMWACLVVKKVQALERQGDGPKKIEKAIRLTPPDLDELYGRLTESMGPASLKLIQWICFATRPLSIDELPWAMAVEADCPHRSLQACQTAEDIPNNAQMELQLQTLSRGLAEVTRTQAVQFIHQSVKDYFVEKGLPAPGGTVTWTEAAIGAHFRFSRICVRYLAMEEIGRSTSYGDKDFPFLRYATTSWLAHTKQCDAGGVPQEDLLALLAWPSNALVRLWARVYQKIDLYSKDCPAEVTSLVHVISEHGVTGLLAAILQRADQITVDVDVKDRHDRTPLHLAADNGCEAIAKLLLEAGAEKETKNGKGDTPLHWAAFRGHEAIARLLLEAGAEKEAKGETGRTPLHFAAHIGHETVASLLLEAGAEKEARDDDFKRTPLHWAAYHAYNAVARLLTEAGAEKEAKDADGRTPLGLAAHKGREVVTRLLLEAGAEKEAKDEDGRTPLHLAANSGRKSGKAVAELLLEAGAEK